MPDKQDAALLVQLAQWGTSMGLEEATIAIFSDEFDPDAADVSELNVTKVLAFGETVGALTKHGLIDMGLVLDWIWVAGVWARVGPAAKREREKRGVPGLYENFEALAAEDG